MMMKKFFNLFNPTKPVNLSETNIKLLESEEYFFNYLANGEISYCKEMVSLGFNMRPEFVSFLEDQALVLYYTSLLSVKSPHPMNGFKNCEFIRAQKCNLIESGENKVVWKGDVQKNAAAFLGYMLDNELFTKRMIDLILKDVNINAFPYHQRKMLTNPNNYSEKEVENFYNEYRHSLNSIMVRGNDDIILFTEKPLVNIFTIGFEPVKGLYGRASDIKNILKSSTNEISETDPSWLKNIKQNSLFYGYKNSDISYEKSMEKRSIIFKNGKLAEYLNLSTNFEQDFFKIRDVTSLFFIKDLVHSLVNKGQISHSEIFNKSINLRPGLRGLALFAVMDNFQEVSPLLTEYNIDMLSEIPHHGMQECLSYLRLGLKKEDAKNNFEDVKKAIQRDKIVTENSGIENVVMYANLPPDFQEKILSVMKKLNQDIFKDENNSEVIFMAKNIKKTLDDIVNTYENLSSIVDKESPLYLQMLQTINDSEGKLVEMEKSILEKKLSHLNVSQRIARKM